MDDFSRFALRRSVALVGVAVAEGSAAAAVTRGRHGGGAAAAAGGAAGGGAGGGGGAAAGGESNVKARADACALEMIVDVVARYIHELGVEAHAMAEMNGRAKCDMGDMLNAMAIMPIGPTSALELNAALDRIHQQVAASREKISEWDWREAASREPLFGTSAPPRTASMHAHIPDFLPPPPEEHTYRNTQVPATGRNVDARSVSRRHAQEQLESKSARDKLHRAAEAKRKASELTGATPDSRSDTSFIEPPSAIAKLAHIQDDTMEGFQRNSQYGPVSEGVQMTEPLGVAGKDDHAQDEAEEPPHRYRIPTRESTDAEAAKAALAAAGGAAATAGGSGDIDMGTGH